MRLGSNWRVYALKAGKSILKRIIDQLDSCSRRFYDCGGVIVDHRESGPLTSTLSIPDDRRGNVNTVNKRHMYAW